MNAEKKQIDTLDESELFRLGGKKSNLVIVPAEIKYQHIKIEDFDKPVPAIAYNGNIYSLFRASNNWSEVEKLTSRLSADYIITVIPKGWAIWVFEY
ncbi:MULTISPECIES: hypothetical protein [Pseudanabaena]|uniref:Uncharacterized protein n=2 Tax=Pseudanabaena TaxID=1152 RepID=L8MYG1_9CYAN|nr:MULTISPECIES: hypothetical protein [Pseudanabaena]ELS31018.1 hypothetical protein Pse7429DRAFT_3787 [Pseudanabaena biceps PCC 7429]MDG3496715.1 hypothetical protein [Pseudanabaena catenata USMAC16]